MSKKVASVLVQGCSRGIGLQFCKTLLCQSSEMNIIATCRSPQLATELQGLKQNPSFTNRLHVLQIDIKDEAQIKAASDFVQEEIGKLDLLINCGGILHPSGRGETSLKDVTMEGLIETNCTNAFGPLLMGKHFGKLLVKGDGLVGTQSADEKQRHSGLMVNISAKVGSITDNGLGGWYSYRMSKSALNMATKNMSMELGRGRNKVVCVTIHPGTVDTQLSRPYHKNVKTLFSTEDSVTKMLSVINSLTTQDTGKFFTYDKVLLPF